MKIKSLIIPGILAFFSATCVQAETLKETIFRAMQDEQLRSMQHLSVGDLPRPYNIEYLLTIRHSKSAHAVLGTIDDIDSGTTVTLTARVRIGGPKFDNTNFFDVSLGFFGSSDDEETYQNRRIPQDLSYNTLRRELWLATDACFKQSVEMYAKKEASLKNRTRTDTTWDYSYLAPQKLESVSPFTTPKISVLQTLAEKASAVFTKYPSIQRSRVGVEIMPEEVFYMNTEGRTVHKTEQFAGFEVVASTQAADGTPLAQHYSAYAPTLEQLPSEDSLVFVISKLAATLDKQTQAPTIEAYSGPVLFTQQAAAQVFAQVFAPQLVAQRPPLSEGGFSTGEKSMAFQNKIGARVLPEFLSVSDTPSLTTWKGAPVAGAYVIDDEAIPAQDVQLVHNGYLKTLLSSRVPTKRVKGSNGHQRGGGAMYSVLELSATEGKQKLDAKTLKARLLKLVKDRDLPYGIIVKSLLDQNILYTGLYGLMGGDLPVSQGEGKIAALETYRVYPDGREELLRGVELAGIGTSSFKDIIAVSRNSSITHLLAPSVLPAFVTGGSQYQISSIITPDLLFEDAEIRPLEGDMPKPPSLTNPLN